MTDRQTHDVVLLKEDAEHPRDAITREFRAPKSRFFFLRWLASFWLYMRQTWAETADEGDESDEPQEDPLLDEDAAMERFRDESQKRWQDKNPLADPMLDACLDLHKRFERHMMEVGDYLKGQVTSLLVAQKRDQALIARYESQGTTDTIANLRAEIARLATQDHAQLIEGYACDDLLRSKYDRADLEPEYQKIKLRVEETEALLAGARRRGQEQESLLASLNADMAAASAELLRISEERDRLRDADRRRRSKIAKAALKPKNRK